MDEIIQKAIKTTPFPHSLTFSISLLFSSHFSPMDSNSSSLLPSKTPSPPPPLEEQEDSQTLEETPPKPLPFSSISLSLSLFSLPKPSPKPLSPFITNLKIPSQISSLSLSKPHSTPKPSKPSSHSLLTPTPLSLPSHFPRRRHPDPSAAAAGRRTALLWFRSDLRLHDNEALSAASADSLSLLPVFLFDPRDFGRSPSGFDKTGPYRARFLLQSVSDLRSSLRARGSDLVVRIGRPETVLVELARAVGADAVYAHREVSSDEVRAEERVERAMEEEGVEVKFFWGSTLYHIEDVPFDLDRMPTNYGGFRERVKGVDVRRTIEALESVTGLPARGDVEPGDVPSLVDLGLSPPAPAVGQDGNPAVGSSLVGGETEALERLKKFAAECQAQPKKEGKDCARDSIYGANFSCKISPWLATGCLSPRFMFEELKKTANRAISASAKKDGAAAADSGMNWLMFELLWRDFFRFITKKYSSNKRKTEAVPATACTGALA